MTGQRTDRAARGKAAEDRACQHLQQQGLRALTRNFRCRQGEIDLVMEEGRTLVFVEVRYRLDPRFGSAAETVDARKRARIVTAAQYFLQQHPGASRRPCRFDVVALGGEEFAIDWIKNAFDLS
jgi:putative endonuclease